MSAHAMLGTQGGCPSLSGSYINVCVSCFMRMTDGGWLRLSGNRCPPRPAAAAAAGSVTLTANHHELIMCLLAAPTTRTQH
jgi:hypothetical protein